MPRISTYASFLFSRPSYVLTFICITAVPRPPLPNRLPLASLGLRQRRPARSGAAAPLQPKPPRQARPRLLLPKGTCGTSLFVILLAHLLFRKAPARQTRRSKVKSYVAFLRPSCVRRLTQARREMVDDEASDASETSDPAPADGDENTEERLGISLRCVSCHGHPFAPLSYASMQR